MKGAQHKRKYCRHVVECVEITLKDCIFVFHDCFISSQTLVSAIMLIEFSLFAFPVNTAGIYGAISKRTVAILFQRGG